MCKTAKSLHEEAKKGSYAHPITVFQTWYNNIKRERHSSSFPGAAGEPVIHDAVRGFFESDNHHRKLTAFYVLSINIKFVTSNVRNQSHDLRLLNQISINLRWSKLLMRMPPRRYVQEFGTFEIAQSGVLSNEIWNVCDAEYFLRNVFVTSLIPEKEAEWEQQHRLWQEEQQLREEEEQRLLREQQLREEEQQQLREEEEEEEQQRLWQEEQLREQQHQLWQEEQHRLREQHRQQEWMQQHLRLEEQQHSNARNLHKMGKSMISRRNLNARNLHKMGKFVKSRRNLIGKKKRDPNSRNLSLILHQSSRKRNRFLNQLRFDPAPFPSTRSTTFRSKSMSLSP